jgi:predicted helicase
MTFDEVLKFFREADTQVEKGKQFEKLMRNWLLTDPRYNTLQKVWLWSDFPARDQFGTGHDVGIDLVAQNEFGEYWAIQCKCYKETTPIALPSVTNFIAASNKKFIAPDTGAEVRFAHRLWVSTTDNWTTNAEEALEGQEPAITRISLFDLQTSPVKWEEIFAGKDGKEALQDGKKPREHQLNALSAAEKYFQTHDRGKLIMACGTGKTYTSLYMMESMLNHKGLVLFWCLLYPY